VEQKPAGAQDRAEWLGRREEAAERAALEPQPVATAQDPAREPVLEVTLQAALEAAVAEQDWAWVRASEAGLEVEQVGAGQD